MTEPDNGYGEEIRRALSAAADLIVPAGDGLDKIRGRVAHRSMPYAWFVAYATYVPHQLVLWFRVAATGLASAFRNGRAAPAPEPGGHHRPSARQESLWLKPTLAAVGALAIVAVAAAVILPRLHQTVNSTGYNDGGAGQSVGATAGSGTSPTARGSGTLMPQKNNKRKEKERRKRVIEY